MALSVKQKNELLARTLPQRREVQRLLNNYLERTGLQPGDFAKRIGYSAVALRFFISDGYGAIAGNDTAIRAAILDFINTHPIEPLTESEGRLYETENVRLIRDCFYQSLDGRRAYYFRGAPGSQKSFVLLHLIAELNRAEISKNGHGRRAFYVYCRQNMRPHQLMKEVALAAGCIAMGDTGRIFRNLRFDLGSRKVLFVFDEAQHLNIECLETLRELHDMPPRSGLLFAGSHQLEQTFQRLDMEQWASRLRKGRELPGIQESEAVDIIRAELGDIDQGKIQKIIRQCCTTDQRKGREVKYISARMLFFALEAIQERKQKGAKG